MADSQSSCDNLLAILATPPLSSGAITRGRVARAADALGFERWSIANLLDVSTSTVRDISACGREQTAWLTSRTSLRSGVENASAVLLAYGTSVPSGPARRHWKEQIEWIVAEVRMQGQPMLAWGGLPRHPSRWQRYLPMGVGMATAYETMLLVVD
jgi:hypothetical protein